MVALDKQLDVVGTSFSPTVREAICLVNAEVSFERGQDLLERLTGIRMSVEEGRLIAEDQGRELERQDQAEIEKAWQAKAPKPREACSVPQRLYVSPDGTHIPILGQKECSEVKVATRWSEQLYKGRFNGVLAALKRLRGQTAAVHESIRQTIGYFKSNRKRIRYGYLRRKGYFIGSGVTESSCKHLVGTRLKRAGMHWDKQQAQAILQLRLARLNTRWDYLWN